MSLESITPNPTALKALAHPVRLRILGLLRGDGPATATRLADRLGLNTGATSYHLRQLAEHGFIEEDLDRGNGRDRWWRAAHQATRWDDDPADPTARDAVDAFAQAVAIVHTESLQRAVEERPLLRSAWRRVSTVSDWALHLTVDDAADLLERLNDLFAEFVLREVPADSPTDDSAVMMYQLHAFPRPGTIAGETP